MTAVSRLCIGLGVIVAASSFASTSVAQSRACADPRARDFDFWIGDWDIRQSFRRQDGTWLELPARTSVTAALEGCALVERWTGQVMFFWEGMTEPEPVSGLSVRAYDPTTAQWYIHWMDTRVPRFDQPYVGTFANGRGEFFRRWETPEGNRVGRVTFHDMTANSVEWALAISSDGRRSWQTIWTMRMHRRANAPGGR